MTVGPVAASTIEPVQVAIPGLSANQNTEAFESHRYTEIRV